MRGGDWTRNAILVGIALCLLGAWRIYDRSADAGDGRTGATALVVVAAFLAGGLLVDWAKRPDDKDDPPPPKGGKRGK